MPLYSYATRALCSTIYHQAYVTGQHHGYYPYALAHHGACRSLFWRKLVVHLNDVRLRALSSGDRQNGFDSWLNDQLQPNTPYFTRVQSIIDPYLWATVGIAELHDSLRYENQTSSPQYAVIKRAADCAYRRLRPLHDEAMNQRAGIVSEAAYMREEELRAAERQTDILVDNMDQSLFCDDPLTAV